MGKKKRPFYRIVAADSRASRDGRFIEMVGTYDPVATPHKVEYKEDRVFYWLSNGAQPTDTVKSLLRGKGLWLKWTLVKQGADESKIASELAAWEKSQVEKEQRLAEKEAQEAKEKQKKKEAEAKEAEAAAAAEAEAAKESQESSVDVAEEKSEATEPGTDAEKQDTEKEA